MSKLWQLAPALPSEIQDRFPELSSLILQVLFNRGLIDQNGQEAPAFVERFLAPEYQNMYSPFLFQDMQKSVDRIWQAIDNKEKIVIYGDYDADAVTANAVLQQTFRHLGVDVSSYIPDRFTEGYGLNVEAFTKLKSEGAQVVITVDCGTNSVDVAEYCLANNIDLIITDHHEITGATPQAYALINPKNPADVYPDNQITGVGVAYKLAKAILSREDDGWDKWLLDLVAIGTVADCHSLLGENRILVKFGLRVLGKTKWLGLRQLMENANLDLATTTLDTRTLGFTIAPRINAAGRLEHADVALQLLLTKDFAQAIDLSNRLEEINRRRQDLTGRIVSEAREQAELILDRPIILVSAVDWPKGLVGLAAGRLAEQYHKPVIVLSKGSEECTGSARSRGNFDIVECLKSASQYLVKFGGHKQAAGLTLRTADLENFYAQILKFAQDRALGGEAAPVLELDAKLTEADLTLDRFQEISQLEPFGVGNPKPKFLLEQALVASFKLVGTEQQHLQLKLQIGERSLDCIGFSMSYLAKNLAAGSSVDVAGELLADTWNGVKKLKLRLIDLKLRDSIQPF